MKNNNWKIMKDKKEIIYEIESKIEKDFKIQLIKIDKDYKVLILNGIETKSIEELEIHTIEELKKGSILPKDFLIEYLIDYFSEYSGKFDTEKNTAKFLHGEF